MIVPAHHREPTSVRMNKKTNTVFDVRGQPVLQGDFVRGCLWPNDEPAGMFSVDLSDLQQLTGMLRTGSGDLQSPVASVSLEAYRGLVHKGHMQLTSNLDKLCMRVMGFLRIEPDKDSEELMAMKDPLFAVVHVLTTAVNPVIDKLDPASRMLLVPRHHSGQWYFVKSGLTGPAAIDVMFRYAAVGTNQILVSQSVKVQLWPSASCPAIHERATCT